MRFRVVLILVFTASAVRAQCPSFSSGLYYPNAPTEPRAIATGDFDGDGHLDLAVGGLDSATVLILFGDGAGAFPRSMQLEAASDVQSIFPADLNGDGKLDLAVATIGGLSIFINQGGSLFTEQTYNFGAYPTSVVVADFNGDGKPDIVTVNSASIDATVLLNNGDGTFAPAQRYPLDPEKRPLSVAVADFNGDGKLDFAAIKAGSARVSVFLGNGDGTFTPAPDTFTTFQPVFIATADINRDGKADLIISYANTALGTVMFGNGDGTFTAPNDIPGAGSWSVTVADLNHDGIPDLVMPMVSSDDVALLLGRGDGTFETPIVLSAPMRPSAAAVGDFNGDGQMDLAVTNQASNSVAVFLSTCPVTHRKHAVKR